MLGSWWRLQPLPISFRQPAQATALSLLPKQALTGGDAETLAANLCAARTGVVQELAAVSTESAARVNPALLQLRMLDDLAAAGNAALPAAELVDLTGKEGLVRPAPKSIRAQQSSCTCRGSCMATHACTARVCKLA